MNRRDFIKYGALLAAAARVRPSSLAQAGPTPLTHHSAIEQFLPGRFRAEILAYPRFYYDSTNHLFLESNRNFVPSDDPNYDVMVRRGVYSAHVSRSGAFKTAHDGKTLKLKLSSLVLFNRTTGDFMLRSLPTLPIPVVTENRVVWQFANGIRYEMHYDYNLFRDVLVLPQAVKNWIKQNLVGTWAEADTYVGAIYDADASGLGVFSTVDAESLDIIDGRIRQGIVGGRVEHDNYVSERYTPNLAWKKRLRLLPSFGKMLDIAPLASVLSPDGDIRFNTSQVFQQGVSPTSYSGCTDTYADSYAATTNYGGGTTFNIYNGGVDGYRAVIAFDCSGTIGAGATINTCQLSINSSYCSCTGEVLSAYRLLKPWVEGTATWNQWDTNLEWGTAGLANASDAGTYNTGDGTDYDRRATADATVTSPTTGWVNLGSSAGMVATLQSNLDNSKWYGWALLMTLDGDVVAASSENATSGNRPKLTVDYTAASGAVPRRPIQY